MCYQKTSRNVELDDLADGEADHIVFDGLTQDDIKVEFDESANNPALLFKTEDANGNVVTLARWKLSSQALSSTSWQPLFDEIYAGLSQIMFIDQDGNSTSLNTTSSLHKFFYNQLAYAESNQGITDSRGRVFNQQPGIPHGTKGDDIIFGDDALAIVIGGQGKDILVTGSGNNIISASADDSVDATQGFGAIAINGNNVKVVVGDKTKEFTILTSNGFSDNSQSSQLVLDGVSIEKVRGNELKLSNGGTIHLQSSTIGSIVLQDGSQHSREAFISNHDELTSHLAPDFITKEYHGSNTVGHGKDLNHLYKISEAGTSKHGFDDHGYEGDTHNYAVVGSTQNDDFRFAHPNKVDGIKKIYDQGGEDTLQINHINEVLKSALFRRVDDNLEIITLDRNSMQSLDMSTQKIVVLDHFEADGKHAIETIKDYRPSGNSDTNLTTADINKLVEATATFLAESGAEDDGGSLVIGENYNQLSQITASALA